MAVKNKHYIMLKELYGNKPSILGSILIVSRHVLVYFLFVYLGTLALELDGWFFSTLGIVIVVLVLGSRFRAVNNMSHEALHNAFCKVRSWNEFWGEVLAIIELSRFKRIRKEHHSHHLFLGNFEKDLDFKGLEKYGFGEKIDRKNLIKHIKNILFLKHIPDYFFMRIYDSDSPIWSKGLRFAYLVMLMSLFYYFAIEFILFFLLPYCIIYQSHKYLIDYLDHGGLLGNEGEMNKSRNMITRNCILRAFFFPRNDGYHLIHHLYPRMPVKSFNKVHSMLIKNNKDYRNNKHYSLEQLKEWVNS